MGAAARRLQRVVAATVSGSTSGGGDPDSLPGGAPQPPRLLTSAQLQGYIENGFVALPVNELPAAWHADLAAELAEHRFKGTEEPQLGSNLVQHAQLSTLLATPTVRGALTSVLGPDFVQYPNRALQSTGKPDHRQSLRTTDDKWHKDQCYVPVRHHRTRWAILFYCEHICPASSTCIIIHRRRCEHLPFLMHLTCGNRSGHRHA
jgi:hypothetical protein